MTMRSRAVLLVLTLLLSPLASAVCELKCAPLPASQPVTGHASCHDANSNDAYFLQAHLHRCVTQHSGAVTIGIERGATFSARKPLPTHLVSSVEGCRVSPIECASAPPGTGPLAGAARSSSPPLRI
jgi:hypothetical protein